MIVIQHKEIDKIATPYIKPAQALVDSAKPDLIKIYCKSDVELYSHSKLKEKYRDAIENKSRYRLEELLALLKGDLRDAMILDIGCGAMNSLDRSDETPENLYEPWFCRLLHHLGFKVVGLDITSNETEKFENYKVDLCSDSLSFLEGKNFDIATESGFLISPLLERALGGFRHVEAFKKRLIKQLESIVKPNGYFIITDEVN